MRFLYANQKQPETQPFLLQFFIFCLLFFSGTNAEINETGSPTSSQMNLLVVDTLFIYIPYAEFCKRNPEECDLNGPSVITLSPEINKTIHLVNSSVNRDIQFDLDIEQYGNEEYWTYPHTGGGDCEDKSLEKRSRLVKFGIPRSVLRLAIATHKQLFHSHCLLTIETIEGTYILDTFTDEIMIWHQAPYNYEMREKPDGKWDRFDQGIWSNETVLETK